MNLCECDNIQKKSFYRLFNWYFSNRKVRIISHNWMSVPRGVWRKKASARGDWAVIWMNNSVACGRMWKSWNLFNYSRDYCSFDRLLDLFYNIYVVLSAAIFLIHMNHHIVFTKQHQLRLFATETLFCCWLSCTGRNLINYSVLKLNARLYRQLETFKNAKSKGKNILK